MIVTVPVTGRGSVALTIVATPSPPDASLTTCTCKPPTVSVAMSAPVPGVMGTEFSDISKLC